MSQIAPRTEQDQGLNWLMTAMSRMVRPMVRFSIGRVSCSALVDLIRMTYVHEARRYLEEQNPGKKVTRSSLALLCGMDGRAIKTFEDDAGREYVASDVCSEAMILEMWNNDPTFHDEKGEPIDLLIHGPQITFQRLVNRAAGRAVTVQTALEKLVESGNVSLSKDQMRVSLVNPFYQPVKASERTSIEASSLALGRLGKTLNHNLTRFENDAPPWLQQDRWTTRIPEERVDVIRTEMRALLKRHIGEVEDYLDKEEQPPSHPDEAAIGVGWYYWEKPPVSDTSLSKD